jgi:hypothetical protein
VRGERTLCESLQESKRSGKPGRDGEETVQWRRLLVYSSQIFICILDSMSIFFRLEKSRCGPLRRASPLSLSHGLAKDVHSSKTQQRVLSCHRRSLIADRIWLERCSGLTLHIFAHQIDRGLIGCLALVRNAVSIHVSSDLSSDRYWKTARSKELKSVK